MRCSIPFALSLVIAGCGDNGSAGTPDAPKTPDAAEPDAGPEPLGFNDLEGGEIRLEWIQQYTAAGVRQTTARAGAYFYKSMDPGKFSPPAFPGCVDMRDKTKWPLAQGNITSLDVGGVTIKSQTGQDIVLTKRENAPAPNDKDAFGRAHDLWWNKPSALAMNDGDTYLPPNESYDLVLAGSAEFQAQTIEDFAFMPAEWEPLSPPASGGATPGSPVLIPAGQDFTMTYTPVTSSNLPPGLRVNTFVAFTGAGHTGPIIACQEEGTDGSITLPAAMVDILLAYTPGRFVRQQLTHTHFELMPDGQPKPPGERKRVDVLTIWCTNTGWAAAP